MSDELRGRTVAFLVANDGVEQVELTGPWEAIEQAGGRPVLIAPDIGKVRGRNHLDPADAFEADVAVASASADDFDALVLPGGVANADDLRARPDVVAFARAFFDGGKPVAAICHAPWTLVEAGVLPGRRLTSWPSLRTDITNAGGEWVDQQVVRDEGANTLITSRKPDDLRAFCAEVVRVFAGVAGG